MAHTISGASLTDIQQRLNTTGNYHPLDADTFADWSMQAGDTVTLTRDNENYTSPVHTLKTVWKGSPQTTISSTGNKEREAVSTQAKSKYSSSSGINNAQGIHSYVWNAESTIYSYIDQTATYIAQGVEDVENQLGSAILQTANEIRSEVHAANSTLYSYIDQTATYIESVVADVNNDLGSAILQTANEIRSEVHASSSNLYSYIDQTATYIESVVADVNNDLGSAILQTASQIRSEVHASNSELYSYVDQTATYIQSVVEDVNNDLGSAILQTASQIRSEVHASNSELYSYVDQTATYIRQEVADTESNLRSSINQQANKISLVVDGSNNIKAAQIVAAINDDGTSETLISANKILLDGNTTVAGLLSVEDGGLKVTGNTFFNGNVTMASGKEIVAGDIRATGVRFPGSNPGDDRTLTLSDVTGMIVKAEVDNSTNTLKLWKKGDADDSPSITFSKAASVSSLTGDWSGSTLTVKTNPVIAGLNYTVGFGGSYNAHNTEFEVASNGSLAVSELMGIKFLDAPIQVSYLTGASSAPVQVYTKNISFNPNSLLKAMTGTDKITANGTFTPGTDYIGFSSVEVDVQGGITPEAPYGTAIDAYTEKKTGSITANNLNSTFTLSSGTYRPTGTTTDIAAVTLKLGSNNIGRINIPLTTQTVTSNGTYIPGNSYVGFSKVEVNVPTASATVSLSWNSTGTSAGTTNSVTGTPLPSGTPATHYIGLSQDADFTSNRKYVYVKYATDASTVAQGGGTRIGVIEVNASTVRTAGQNDVTLNDPTWGTAPSSSPSSNSNSMTVTTNGRPTQLSKSRTFYLGANGWTNGTNTVYLYHTSVTSSNRLAKIDVTAPAITVTATQGQWSNGTIRVSANVDGVEKASTTVSLPTVTATDWQNTTGTTWRTRLTIGGAYRYSDTKEFSVSIDDSAEWKTGTKTIVAKLEGSEGARKTISIPNVDSTTWMNTTGTTWRTSVSLGGTTRYSDTKEFSVTTSQGSWSNGVLPVTVKLEGATATTANVSIPAVTATEWQNTTGTTWRTRLTIGGMYRYSDAKAFSVTASQGSWSSGVLPVTLKLEGATAGTTNVSLPAVTKTVWENTTGTTWRTRLTIGGAYRYSDTATFSVTATQGSWSKGVLPVTAKLEGYAAATTSVSIPNPTKTTWENPTGTQWKVGLTIGGVVKYSDVKDFTMETYWDNTTGSTWRVRIVQAGRTSYSSTKTFDTSASVSDCWCGVGSSSVAQSTASVSVGSPIDIWPYYKLSNGTTSWGSKITVSANNPYPQTKTLTCTEATFTQSQWKYSFSITLNDANVFTTNKKYVFHNNSGYT